MKTALLTMCLLMIATVAEARGRGGGSKASSSSWGSTSSHSVKAYVKKDGTYVAPSRATNANSSKADNWSTQGNYNPYTGKQGTKKY